MKSNNNIFKTINLGLVLLLILSSTASTIASPPENKLEFVRIDLPSLDEASRFSTLAIPIHARIYDDAGNLSVLAYADTNQQETLAHLAFTVQVLDENPQGKDYYLVRLPTSETESELRSVSTLLDKVGNQILVAISPEEYASFFQLGLTIKHISTQPIPFFHAQINNALPSMVDPDPAVQAMIDQITPTAVYSLTGDLTGEWPVTIGGSNYTIATRHSRNATASEMATQFAYEHFEALGLDVSYHDYNHPIYGSRRNVEAVQEGMGQPERIFLITAHIDNMPSSILAPGADDNGSGTAGVMLAAEVLSQYDFDCTLRFVLFTGEEQGLFGSHYYAQDVANTRDRIEAVLNLDMIAYDSDEEPILDLHTRIDNQRDLSIANTFVNVVDTYNLDLDPIIRQDNMGYSDHDSFWDFGFPAILAIEDNSDFSPYYHTVNDNLASLNIDYFTNFVQAAVGTFAHMGCLIPPDGIAEGVVREAVGSTPLVDASIEAFQDEQVVDSTLSNGDGTYELSIPAGVYTLRASKSGYAPQYLTDIEISSDQKTTVNFSLGICEPIIGADFTISPPTVETGETIYFTSSVTGGSPLVSISWDFNDNTIGYGETIQHTYIASNTYQIEMTASNCGLPVIVTHTLDVTGYPAINVIPGFVDFQLDPEEVATTILAIQNIGGDTLSWNIVENPDVDWLVLRQYEGETLPAISTINILTFTAPSDISVYTTTLRVTSNDQERPLVEVPITLIVGSSFGNHLFLPIIVRENP